MRIVVHLDQGDDRPAGAVLHDEVDDFLREPVAVGVRDLAAQATWNLQGRAHRDLGMDPVRGQDALDRNQHGQFAVGQEPLRDRRGRSTEPKRVLQ